MTSQNNLTKSNRLTGKSELLNYEKSRGKVLPAVSFGRPKLYTSYVSNQALLNTKTKRFWVTLFMIGVVAAPFLVPADFTYLLTLTAIYALAGVGLNILSGYAGQISLGHAFFVGLGAYTAAVFGANPGSSTWGLGLDLALVLPLSAIIPGLVGLIVAPVATRVRGLYLAVLTLAILMVGEHLFKIMIPVTGGEGMGRGVANRTFLGVDMSATYAVGPLIIKPEVSFFLFCLAILVVLALGAKNLARTQIGRAFAAVRDRDLAAEVMGVNLMRTKNLAFAISSAYAGVAGALLSMLIGRISPEQWNLFLSVDFLAVVVIGGIATISGTILGAIFVVLTPRLLEFLTAYIPFISTSSGGLLNVFQLQTIIFGVLIVLFITLEPRGIFGLWIRIKNYFTSWPFSY